MTSIISPSRLNRRQFNRRGPSPPFQEMGELAPEHVREADRSVEQRANCEQRALGNPVALARLLQMLDDRFVAHPENLANLPVGLALSDQNHTFPLTFSENWLLIHRQVANPGEAPGSLEGKGADQLSKRQMAFAERSSRCGGKGT